MEKKFQKLNRPEYLAAIGALGFGMIVHLFGLVNVLHNSDDIWIQPTGYGTGLRSGRWFLSLLGDLVKNLLGGYNISWIKGLLFMLLLAVSAGFIVSALEIRSKKSAVLVGMAFITFPTVTATMFYPYTTSYYGIAILLSVLAAWILPRHKLGIVFSAMFSAMALGIYQAYLPMTVSLLVLMLLRQTLQGKEPVSRLFLRGVYYCAAIALGLILYYAILKLSLAIEGVSLNTYQGIDNMGKLNPAQIPGLVLEAFLSFFTLASTDYCSLSQIRLLQIAYLVVLILSAVMILFVLLTKVRSLRHGLFCLFLCAVFPVAVNLIVIMCPDSRIYTLMVYSFVFVLTMPLVILEAMDRNSVHKVLSRIATVFLITAILANSYLANVNYTALYFGNRQAENFFSGLVTQVRMTEGFDSDLKWAFLGKVDDPLLTNPWDDVLLYEGNTSVYKLTTDYSWASWIKHYVGYTVPTAGTKTLEALQANPDVQAMPCWPDDGSIRIMDDVIVIKFQNP